MPKSTMQVMTDEEIDELLSRPLPKERPNLPQWLRDEIDECFKTLPQEEPKNQE